MTLADQLRAAISETHTAIERTPLAGAMIGGAVRRAVYADWLAQMGHLHAGLESALVGCPDVAAVYSPADMDRTDAIARDRRVFPTDGDSFPNEAVVRLCDRFAEWREQAPWKLLGALYVLEGSRMGSMAMVRPLARAFGLIPQPGGGLDYHMDGIATRPMRWQQTRAALSALPLTEFRRADVTAAAVEVMHGLYELYTDSRFMNEPSAVSVATA